MGLVGEDCEKLQRMSIKLLERLKSNMPDKTGEAQASGWNFVKELSIMHRCMIYYDILPVI